MKYVQTSQEIATVTHRGQYRRHKDGRPSNEAFIHHCRRISEKFDDWPEAQALSWLHDTIEDHPEKVSYEMLAQAGIPQSVLDALKAITKIKGEPYDAYLRRVKDNVIARAVKIRDNIDNLASDPTDAQIIKYTHSLSFLVL